MARQLASDAGDLAPELLAADATPAGTLADDDKPIDPGQPTPAARALIQSEPSEPPARQVPGQKAAAQLSDEAIRAGLRILEAAERE